jgi:hypothetical protein
MNMTPLVQANGPITSRFKGFLDRYRGLAYKTFAAIAAVTFVVAQYFPVVQQLIVQTDLIQYLTLLILLDLAVYMHQAPHVALSENQDESLPRLIAAVPSCRKETVDLLEYAGMTILPLIRTIRREGIQMRMLVKHPDTVEGIQKQRMIATLDTLFNSIFENYSGQFEIRCYRLPFTIRGRRLGMEILELGWLTHDRKGLSAHGHSNPSVIADLSSKSSAHLRAFFDKTFTDLWNDNETEDGRAVLQRLQSRT